jgi:hypothetical protein
MTLTKPSAQITPTKGKGKPLLLGISGEGFGELTATE